MEKSSLNSELFGATNLFNNVTKEFRDGVELKNHNRRLKCYRNSFIAHKGVSFLIELLKSKEEFAHKIQNREQAISLMNIFLRWGIIVKIYPLNNALQFQDNKDLYTLADLDKSEDDQMKPINEKISKSTNDLLMNSEVNDLDRPSTLNRANLYRSFGKSTYSQFNQIGHTIKRTTSTIFKSTNSNMTKFANHTAHTLNKLNNRSGNNLIKKLNGNFRNKSTNPIKRSTSTVTGNSISQLNSIATTPVTVTHQHNRSLIRSQHHQDNKENLIVNNNNRKFERNYRGQLNRSNNSSIASLPVYSNPIVASNDRTTAAVSLNPMNKEFVSLKFDETEGNNLIRFLNKLSESLKKKPLKPVNNTSSSFTPSTNGSQIIMNRDQVQYIHHIPDIQRLQSIHNQTMEHKPINYLPATGVRSLNPSYVHHFNHNCLINPISSTCYNTLV